MNKSLAVVILAAGKGTRMNSDIPKVLHQIGDKPMISHVIDTAKELEAEYIIPVLGYKHNQIKEALRYESLQYALQKEQLGTAHAVMQCMDILINFNGNILILYGDVPLISHKTLSKLLNVHNEEDCQGSVLTTELEDPTGYGRIIRTNEGRLKKIVEQADANDQELKVKEINSGIYVFKSSVLFNLLPMVDNKNSQKEYYLPDVLNLILSNNKKVCIQKSLDSFEIQGINDVLQLNKMNKYYENQKL
jgi:UDP-N-acetylglucosamine diphosphorylase/glucosamine-1-phosphate N-acetyltransferase